MSGVHYAGESITFVVASTPWRVGPSVVGPAWYLVRCRRVTFLGEALAEVRA